MKSSIAAPCFRNSGLLTTLNGCVVSGAIASRTFFAVPTGTVLLSTTTVYLFIARPMSRATPSTCCEIGRAVFALRRADRDEDDLGRPNGATARSVVKLRRSSLRLRRTISSRPGS